MKKKWLKKTVSLMLAAAVLITALPLIPASRQEAQAADEGTAQNSSSETLVLTTGEYTLEDRTITAPQGQSAVRIEGNVTLYIEGNVTLTGGNACFQTEEKVAKLSSGEEMTYTAYTAVGAGAGIEVPAGSSLTLMGSGTLTARGGAAANGRDGISPSNTEADKEEPMYFQGGTGGAGAGAGIGGRGADNASSVSSVGTITFGDQNLLVYAYGGEGAESGGSGGNGGTGVQLSKKVTNGAFTAQYYLEYRGGFGGGGGGGGGYPGAGIGSGGAAGGNGGAGGKSGKDSGKAYYTFLTAWPTRIATWWTCGGGGGGGAGQGYANGGGGGGGGDANGRFKPTYNASVHGMPITGPGFSNGGTGGSPGQDGASAVPKTTINTEDDETASGGDPGLASGQGGAAGEGNDNKRKTTAGSDGGAAGTRAGAGTIQVNAGTVRAWSGGKDVAASGTGSGAQDVGSGGGTGEASGTLKILGGSLNTDGNLLDATDGSQKVCPVTVRPYRATSEELLLPTSVTVNGTDWNVGRFTSDVSGNLTIWLPDSSQDYQVIVADPVRSEFAVTVRDGQGTARPTEDLSAALDTANGNITFTKNGYVQGGTSGLITSETVLYGQGGCNVSYEAGKMDYKITLQNAKIAELNVSAGTTADAGVTVTVEGEDNSIGSIQLMSSDSRIEFQGEEDSYVQIGQVYAELSRPYEECTYNTGRYITDIALGIGDTGAEAEKALTDQGYTVLRPKEASDDQPWRSDLNRNAGGAYISLGYKMTAIPDNWNVVDGGKPVYNAGNAIYDFVGRITDKSINYKGSTYETENGTYESIPVYGNYEDGTPGDLNQDAGGDYIWLYVLREKNASESFKSTHDNYLSSLRLYNEDLAGTGISETGYCATCYNGWLSIYDENNAGRHGDRLELNRNAGGDNIWIATGYWYGEQSSQTIDSSLGNGGHFVSNSSGKIVLDAVTSSQFTRYGSPSIEVNNGYMKLGQITSGDIFYDPDPTEVSIMHFHGSVYLPDIEVPDRNWYKATVTWRNYYGNAQSGSITVNGGTLEIGDNGSQIPNKPYGSSLNPPRVTVKSGASLLSGDVSGQLTNADTACRLEITELPKNSHLTQIQSTDQSGTISEYQNLDIWTNDNGNYITYVTAADNGKTLLFADGNRAYYYRIAVADGSAQAEQLSLAELNGASVEENPLEIYPYYAVQGRKVYSRSEDAQSPSGSTALVLDRDVAGGISLMPNANLKLELGANLTEGITMAEQTSLNVDTGQIRTVSSITSTGTSAVTLQGAGLNLSGECQVGTLTVQEGTVTIPSIRGRVEVTGGSVKTDQPIPGAADGNGTTVYQTVVPDWDSQVKVDGKTYPGIRSESHGDGKMYLYLPASAKTLEAGGKFYYLSLDQKTNTMTLIERLDGDGVIDLSEGSAEIVDEELYYHGGKIYRNTNAGEYTVKGKTDGNSLTISSDMTVVLDGLQADCPDGSPICIAEGASVKLLLRGETTLRAADGYAAIHVPETSSVTLENESKGVLNATGGDYAPAVGGNQGEKNGHIRIESGTMNLYGQSCAAVGAGAGETTPEGSIQIGLASVKAVNTLDGDGIGTVPLDSDGRELTLLSYTPEDFQAGAKNTVNGRTFVLDKLNDDGKIYLYLPSARNEVQIGGGPVDVAVPFRIEEVEHGTIVGTLIQEDGTERELTNGDLVLPGFRVQMDTVPDQGYGLKNGPASGEYQIRLGDDDHVILYPIDNVGTEISGLDDWETVSETDDSQKQTDYVRGFSMTLDQNTETVNLGTPGKGTAVAGFRASGEGITAEILVDGEIVKTIKLDDDSKGVSYEWEAAGTEQVSLRFAGSGTVVLESAYLGNTIVVSEITAEFVPVYTLSVELPEMDENEEEHAGMILTLNEKNLAIWDRNSDMDGIQLLEGETVTLVYLDPDGGSVFDSFTLTKGDGVTETIDRNNYPLTMKGDVTVSAQSHLDLYYEVNIPETVALDDAGTSETISMSTLKNLEADEVLSVSVTGTDEQGRATLIRKNADDVLYVPVTNSSNQPFVPNTILLKYKLDEDHKPVLAYGDGRMNFGAPQGTKKAGEYAGSITFSITCEEEKGNP